MKKQTKLSVMLIILGVMLILSSLVISHYLSEKWSIVYNNYSFEDLYSKELEELMNWNRSDIEINPSTFNKYCKKEKEIIQPSKKYVLYNCDYDDKVYNKLDANYNIIHKNISVVLASSNKGVKMFNSDKFDDCAYGTIKELPTTLSNTFPNEKYYFDFKVTNFDSKIPICMLILGIIILIGSFLYLLRLKIKNIAYYFNKHKWTKVVFVISFIPPLLLIFLSIQGSITGFSFYNQTSYGFDAFMSLLIIYSLFFSTFIPILPILLIYDIIYLICKGIVKKERSGKNETKN